MQAGSSFSTFIQNSSNKNYALTKYEFMNGGIIIYSTTSASLLNNNLLGPGETVGIIVTIGSDQLDSGFAGTYFFTDVTTGTSFVVTESLITE